ncbi:uncharacterized protein Fot_27819 [Forsythia ovata]|uniref:HhH-GPD domain-containing protein n=1 Tax=Forsythia ovata TaxID=205694 RepID=A0ABD1TML3_9LAMI
MLTLSFQQVYHRDIPLDQVRRMLRLSDEENWRIRDFQEVHEEAKNRGFGRVFRSPTLFEDMVKCILLCNCQWSRTLSMAKALCELQLELQLPLSNESLANAANKTIPGPLERKEVSSCTKIGNFPSPRELASLDEKFSAKRCNLGYRAGRIMNLAREIVDGRVQLRELEDICGTLSLPEYDKLAEKLKVIDGFGPFTCANVLMCMGFYHVIPIDSETIRHLEQPLLLKFEFGLLAGFLLDRSEVWQFYEEWFGKLSEMPPSSYKLITAANMRPKRNGKNKRIKLSMADIFNYRNKVKHDLCTLVVD